MSPSISEVGWNRNELDPSLSSGPSLVESEEGTGDVAEVAPVGTFETQGASSPSLGLICSSRPLDIVEDANIGG